MTGPRRGVVLRARMTRAVVVRMERVAQDPRYKKPVRHRTDVKARDEVGCKEGDIILMLPTRPLARGIRWRVVSVVGRRAFADRGEETGPAVAKAVA